MLKKDATDESRRFNDLDLQFANWMVRFSSAVSAEVLVDLRLAAMLASNAVSKGHICASLADWSGKLIDHLDERGDEYGDRLCTQGGRYPDLEQWATRLRAAPVVGAPGEFKPLILDGQYRLYLQRYWTYERELAAALIARAQRPRRSIDEQLLKNGLQRLFAENDEKGINWQRVAAVMAILNGLTIISGGPGTGKTFTMAKVLALMAEQARGKSPAVALAAPTGKAAARLREVIRQSKESLNCSADAKALIPDDAATIHRLLGPARGPGFIFNKDNPLPYDVVVVDEASMIDLPLMARLSSALKPDAQLILLGDKEQLASVEPGAVFADICEAADANRFSPDFREQAERLIGHALPAAIANRSVLGDCAVVLEKNYRFDDQSGIALFSELVRAGDGRSALDLLKSHRLDAISWQELPPAGGLARALERHTLGYYTDYLRASEPAAAFNLFNRFRTLCALREGPYGVLSVNQTVREFCDRHGLINREGRWYRGQPLMVTANDYRLKLFNGDIGILLDDPDVAALRAYFPTDEGGFRRIPPVRLIASESAHSVTVHKSQGSEFEHVLILLPDRHSEVVTRELIYTAVTRARKRVEIWGKEEAFIGAVSRRTRRISGLQDRLKNALPPAVSG